MSNIKDNTDNGEFFPRSTRIGNLEKNRKTYYNELKNFAESCGYKIISTEYVNSRTNMTWQSPDGVVFQQSVGSIINNGGFKQKNYSKDYYYNRLVEIASRNGGKVISTEYINRNTPMEFEDEFGQRFTTKPEYVVDGCWNGRCTSIVENSIRQVFNYIFGKEFPTRRDIVVRNEKNKDKPMLELDGYDEIMINGKLLKLAFEYQGYYTHWKNEKVMSTDLEKKLFCENNDIKLLIFDTIDTKLINDDKNFFYHVIDIIKQYDIPVDKNIDDGNFKIDLSSNTRSYLKIKEWKERGLNDGFELLSDYYVNNYTKLKWRSIKDPTWQFVRTPKLINTNGWPKVGFTNL